MLEPITEQDGILLDIRYATPDTIAGRALYRRPVALLTPLARERLLAAAARARSLGLRLRVFDAFRPLEVQEALWQALPDPRYVSNPAEGTALHPRGVAVDLTLADPGGTSLAMGTGFDEMSPLSAHEALDLPAEAIRNRALLLGLMTAAGWEHSATEWWHYHLPGQSGLPLLRAADVPDGPL